jgi:hypothetical protein
VLQGEKAGIPEENADQSIFNFLSKFSKFPQAPHNWGWEGGDHHRSLISAGGTEFSTQIISSTCKPPSSTCLWGGGDGGGLIWAAVGRPQQSDGSLFHLTRQLLK